MGKLPVSKASYFQRVKQVQKAQDPKYRQRNPWDNQQIQYYEMLAGDMYQTVLKQDWTVNLLGSIEGVTLFIRHLVGKCMHLIM